MEIQNNIYMWISHDFGQNVNTNFVGFLYTKHKHDVVQVDQLFVERCRTLLNLPNDLGQVA